MNFFVDIDGTLLPFGKREVPQSAVKAVEKARDLGHRMFLATGRSRAEIDFPILDLFKGEGVFGTGTTVVVDKKEIFKRVMTEREKEKAFAFCKKNNLHVLAQGENSTWVTEEGMAMWNSLLEKKGIRDLHVNNVQIVDEIDERSVITKFLYVTEKADISYVSNSLLPEFKVIGNTLGVDDSAMGEITISCCTKATGIIKALEYLKEESTNFSAIGDGSNDTEMVALSPFGIAMGNACDAVKRVAKYIARDVNDGGFADAVDYVLSAIEKKSC